MTVPFKVGITHGDGRKEFRIARLSDGDFSGLQDQIKSWTSASNFDICYLDEEGDEITISSSDEMKECCEIWKEGGSEEKVKLFVNLSERIRVQEVQAANDDKKEQPEEEEDDNDDEEYVIDDDEYIIDDDDCFEFSDSDLGAGPSRDFSSEPSFTSPSTEAPLAAVPGTEFSVVTNPTAAHFESPVAEKAARRIYGDKMVEYIIAGQLDVRDAGCSDWLQREGDVLVVSSNRILRDKLAGIADAAFRKRNFDSASEVFEIAVNFSNDKADDYYFLAKVMSCAKDPKTLDTLIEGLQYGLDLSKVLRDKCFKHLVNSKVFQELVISIHGTEPALTEKEKSDRRALVICKETIGSPFNDREEEKYGIALQFLNSVGSPNRTHNIRLLRLKDGDVFEILRLSKDIALPKK
eukprot:TRINITY_DN10530_c0_g2_i1.p1 TRINITY_DN10530_c0_g2~~TRINITY_DN10530_c0_g2_i1.p1  ORF type:complete len:408 (+),score=97.35 TRINITY_DN10530_c0_g2_i1:55-1278(+)